MNFQRALLPRNLFEEEEIFQGSEQMFFPAPLPLRKPNLRKLAVGQDHLERKDAFRKGKPRPKLQRRDRSSSSSGDSNSNLADRQEFAGASVAWQNPPHLVGTVEQLPIIPQVSPPGWSNSVSHPANLTFDELLAACSPTQLQQEAGQSRAASAPPVVPLHSDCVVSAEHLLHHQHQQQEGNCLGRRLNLENILPVPDNLNTAEDVSSLLDSVQHVLPQQSSPQRRSRNRPRLDYKLLHQTGERRFL